MHDGYTFVSDTLSIHRSDSKWHKWKQRGVKTVADSNNTILKPAWHRSNQGMGKTEQVSLKSKDTTRIDRIEVIQKGVHRKLNSIKDQRELGEKSDRRNAKNQIVSYAIERAHEPARPNSLRSPLAIYVVWQWECFQIPTQRKGIETRAHMTWPSPTPVDRHIHVCID